MLVDYSTLLNPISINFNSSNSCYLLYNIVVTLITSKLFIILQIKLNMIRLINDNAKIMNIFTLNINIKIKKKNYFFQMLVIVIFFVSFNTTFRFFIFS